jgi:hypothetical protein
MAASNTTILFMFSLPGISYFKLVSTSSNWRMLHPNTYLRLRLSAQRGHLSGVVSCQILIRPPRLGNPSVGIRVVNARRVFNLRCSRCSPVTTNRRPIRPVVQGARSRCNLFAEHHVSKHCRSSSRLNVQDVGCLTRRHPGDDSGHHNASRILDRRCGRLAWAWSLVLTTALVLRPA